ncbi:hypothetical protein [Nakamurella deserti]|uniref:hypothetical protein n=1 Tax=Nakamurella deserti TaxID=2164074 RepID=UPI000DBE8198|nr:hypothetical protein [Nakamurella deserti]
MKLTELEPMLDPRRPLHFDAASAGGSPPYVAVRRPAGGALTDLRSVDAVIARLAAHPPVADPWSEVPPPRPGTVEDLELRAGSAVELFTGAATGLVVALWRARAGRMEAQLRSRAAGTRATLMTGRALAETAGVADVTPLRDAATAAQDAWSALATFDALDRAFAATDIRALSPGVAAGFTRTAPTVARATAAFRRRAARSDGVVWTPDGLVAWHGTPEGCRLFLVPGPDLAAWIATSDATAPAWPTTFVGTGTPIADVPERWRAVLVLLDRLAALGTVAAGDRIGEVDRNDRNDTADRADRTDGAGSAARVPVTRLLMTAAEARHGVEPVDLSNGGTPAPGWRPSHHREVFSATQGRRVRVFVDAARTPGRTPFGPTLVTVLPNRPPRYDGVATP